MIDISKIELKHGNSHDVEDVALCDFLRFFQNRISSVLDVGGHHSHAHYAREARRIVKGRYDAVDILPDPDTALLLDHYHVGDFTKMKLFSFDAMISISAIEHAGLSSYKADDWFDEQQRLVATIFDNARRFVFLTFPFGEKGLVEGQYANITDQQLNAFEAFAESYKFIPLAFDFYFCQHPQMRLPWVNVTRREAAQIPLNPEIEQQTVAVCSWIAT